MDASKHGRSHALLRHLNLDISHLDIWTDINLPNKIYIFSALCTSFIVPTNSITLTSLSAVSTSTVDEKRFEAIILEAISFEQNRSH